MVPEEASESSVGQPETAPDPNAPQRGRRSGRGRRGRGRRRKQKRPQSESVAGTDTPPAGPEMEPELHEVSEFETSDAAEAPLPDEPETAEPPPEAPAYAPASAEPPPPVSQLRQAGPKVSVQMAIEEVNRIIDSLRDSLDDMESVLEMLEQFERQSNADEREIESLRRALRHMQRPRDGGGHSHRGR